MSDTVTKSEIDPSELKRILGKPCQIAAAGKHVAVVCKSRYDREAKCKAVFDALGGNVRMIGYTAIEFSLGGTIEFVSLNSSSGRRADDFDHHTFML